MAGPISVTCPKCKKVMNVPEVLRGKKVRCRGCEAVITVGIAVVAKAQAAKANPAVAKPVASDDEWAAPEAYKLTVDSDKPRCPHCAHDIEDDQRICLNCGYNLEKRYREEVKVVYAKTGGDYTLWLLPGIINLLVALAAIGFIVIIIAGTPQLPESIEWLQTWKWGQVYGIFFCCLFIWYCGKSAVKRLIMNPHPPDQEKSIDPDKVEDD